MSEHVVIGDVHGQIEKLRSLLREAGLIGHDDAWSGRESTLWLLGDFVDRGPDGVGAIDLAMRLQREAARDGGAVHALFGNHDGMLLAAYRFHDRADAWSARIFVTTWQRNGGSWRDLKRLTPERVSWLSGLPAIARVGDDLLLHADATLYAHYGRTIAETNRAVAAVLASDDPQAWFRLLRDFSEHRAFAEGERGLARAEAMLRRFGGRRIVHGHTPITKISGVPAADVHEPLVYAGGRCIDVDGGMYLGGPGFIYRLPCEPPR